MHAWQRRLLLMVAACMMATTTLWPGGTATAAQDSNGWQQLGFKGGVSRLLTPASGPLFAIQRTSAFRSDDAGETWAPVNLPPRPVAPNVNFFAFTIDPTNHTTLYASGAEGLYKSTDDAASWSVALPTTDAVLTLAVSQADSRVIYASLATRAGQDVSRYHIMRSRDGGSSWDQIEDLAGECQVNTYTFQPHPLDPARVMRPQVCNPGGSTNGALAESRDQGSSWTKRFDQASTRPTRVVGGEGVMPERFFLNLWHWTSSRSLLLRSDDDGATWTETTPPWSIVDVPREAGSIVMNGVDTDLSMPNRVYVALNVDRPVNRPPGVPSFIFSRVLVSDDAGLTWTDTGFGGEVFINDLKLGIDGRNLYVSTASGIWRLPLEVGH